MLLCLNGVIGSQRICHVRCVEDCNDFRLLSRSLKVVSSFCRVIVFEQGLEVYGPGVLDWQIFHGGEELSN